MLYLKILRCDKWFSFAEFSYIIFHYVKLMWWTFAKYFSAAICDPENNMVTPPLLCTAPIKVGSVYRIIVQAFRSSFFWRVTPASLLLQYQFANHSNPNYKRTGKGSLKLQLINQRSDFSFALFSGGLRNVCFYLPLPYLLL